MPKRFILLKYENETKALNSIIYLIKETLVWNSVSYLRHMVLKNEADWRVHTKTIRIYQQL